MFTDEQRRAITIDPEQPKNLIVTAGAGSGKTHVLVERFISLLDAHPDWPLNGLVAITFTREAALEMRNRVRRAIEDRVRQVTTAAERDRWTRQMRQMDSARIDTIHALCATILRANAPQAGIDPRFEVIQEADARILLQDAVEDAIQAAIDRDQSAMRQLFDAYDRSTIETELRNLVLAYDWAAIRAGSPADLLAQWVAKWSEGLMTLRDRTLNLIADYRHWDTGIKGSLGDSWAELTGLGEQLEQADSVPAVITVLTEISAMSMRARPSGDWGDDGKQAKDDLKHVRDVCQNGLKEVGDDPRNQPELAEIAWAWACLLADVRDLYQAAKAQLNAMDFDDLERLTADLLDDESVRSRYAGREFKQLLVDEFQDTNAAQWRIVRSLAQPALAGSLFVVGDRKQSIYGFRGADVSVFQSVGEAITDYPHGEALALSVSFRSKPTLIDSFNRLFDRLLQVDETSPVSRYQVALDMPMTAFRDDAATQLPIDMILLDRNLSEDETLAIDPAREWEAFAVGQRIQQMINDGYQVLDKPTGQMRPLTYRDVAILFRRRTAMSAYEKAFRSAELNIPTETIAGAGYYDRQEVWDVLNVLQALIDRGDELALAAALRSPMFQFSDDMLYALRLLTDSAGDRLSLWAALDFATNQTVTGIESPDDYERIQFAHATLQALSTVAGRITIAELIRQILTRTGYLALLSLLPDGTRRARNVEKLVAIARDSGRVTPGEFARYLQDVQQVEARESQAELDAGDAVKLMTIHASKGLEFPVVVIADVASRTTSRNSGVVLVDDALGIGVKVRAVGEAEDQVSGTYSQINTLQKLRDQAEELRLLYVAATRTRDHLILAGTVRGNPDGWLKQIKTVCDEIDWVDGQSIQIDGHPIARVWRPAYDPALPDRLQGDVAPAEPTLNAEPQAPPLLSPVAVEPARLLGHISATQLESLGGALRANDQRARQAYQTRLRADVLDDAPADVRDSILRAEPRVARHVIGDLVHEAVRYWRFPTGSDDDPLVDILRGYAWERRITQADDIAYAVREATVLLRQFQESAVYQMIESARQAGRPVYQEMPFIWKTGEHIIHGVIDVVLEVDDGHWLIVDYKTSWIDGYDTHNPQKRDQAMRDHARRYHLQIGAYAEAVRAKLGAGITLRAMIHYIRYNQMIEIPPQAWQGELSALDVSIGEVIGDRMD